MGQRWFEKDETKQERSRRREKRAAKLYGGRRQPASGALWFRRGDVDAGNMLIEDKYTDHGSYRLSRKVLEKVEREAGPSRFPILRVGIDGRNYIVMREEDVLFLSKEREGSA